jgi:hypothetical protein
MSDLPAGPAEQPPSCTAGNPRRLPSRRRWGAPASGLRRDLQNVTSLSPPAEFVLSCWLSHAFGAKLAARRQDRRKMHALQAPRVALSAAAPLR